MSALIAAAVKMAKLMKAPALEAYPIDKSLPDSSRNIFTGVACAFARAGFQEVARRSPDRPIMRYYFRRSTERKAEPSPATNPAMVTAARHGEGKLRRFADRNR